MFGRRSCCHSRREKKKQINKQKTIARRNAKIKKSSAFCTHARVLLSPSANNLQPPEIKGPGSHAIIPLTLGLKEREYYWVKSEDDQMNGRLRMSSKMKMLNLLKLEAQSWFSLPSSAETFCGDQIGLKSVGPPPAAPTGGSVRRRIQESQFICSRSRNRPLMSRGIRLNQRH